MGPEHGILCWKINLLSRGLLFCNSVPVISRTVKNFRTRKKWSSRQVYRYFYGDEHSVSSALKKKAGPRAKDSDDNSDSEKPKKKRNGGGGQSGILQNIPVPVLAKIGTIEVMLELEDII